MIKGKKILIGITGSIAAYKIPLLIRLLVKEGVEVRVILSSMAGEFVTPLTLSTLSGNPVLSEFYNNEDGTWNSHIDLGTWADLYLIAPVTASTMGKMVSGIADNLLIATYLAAKCPVYFAPAMDVDMFHHPSTQKNIESLKSYGNILIEPETGELASGLTGEGRLQEPEQIFRRIKDHFEKKKDFRGKKVLISAGPTYEAIDPVRFIGNHSSGKMGFAIAEEMAARGAKVWLVSGPVNLRPQHPDILLTSVVSAKEMSEACITEAKSADIVIMAAAVADYTPKHASASKIKKKNDALQIDLVPTEDILKQIGKKRKSSQVIVGFALETDEELSNALKKLQNKNLDLVVLNSLKDKDSGFGYDTNKVTFIAKNGEEDRLGLLQKKEVAAHLADKIKSLI